MALLASVVSFADCPRCGGWARREASRGRWKCRACNWSGVLPAGPEGAPATLK